MKSESIKPGSSPYKGKPQEQILNELFEKAEIYLHNGAIANILKNLNSLESQSLSQLAEHSESSKAVLTVLITSLIQKLHDPIQDIRYHQDNMPGGYAGRSIDTKYITPFLREKGLPHMAESGWLTRSLEQNLPYDFKYPGKITPTTVKKAFLQLLDLVQIKGKSPETYLIVMLAKLLQLRDKHSLDLAQPSGLPISTIIDFLRKHFEGKYKARGAARLPTIAIFSVYQCLVKELKRFDKTVLLPLTEHTTADAKSGRIADIEVRDPSNKVFEAVEVKLEIEINTRRIKESFDKFRTQPVKRYYLLSTAGIAPGDKENINTELAKILNIHGCQVIVNGIYPSLRYYLRMLSNTDDFIQHYVENISKDSSVKYEHKENWNKIVSTK
ncbi:MAG: DNA methyltransferase [Bacteroidetes bacterium]|nr:DNA methyltransferase [Bacteroidota bacterium]MCL5737835.1 DNA methyltransferase [Bacteroidota bacterium]